MRFVGGGYVAMHKTKQSTCVSEETSHYSGLWNGTIHVVAGTGGRGTEDYGPVNVSWSVFKDHTLQHGYVKLTSENHNKLLFQFLHANTGEVVDTFTISREFPDVLGCDNSIAPFCPKVTTLDYS